MASRKSLYSGPTKAKITKQPGKKKSMPATASLETLKNVRKKTRVKYSHAKKTHKNYDGHFCRGQKFLAELISDIRTNGGSSKLDLPELAGIDGDGNDLDDVDVDLLEKAFYRPPNKYSVSAMELYLVQKCCTEEFSPSTAAGIHGAFCDYWDNMWVLQALLVTSKILTLANTKGMGTPMLESGTSMTEWLRLSKETQHVPPGLKATCMWSPRRAVRKVPRLKGITMQRPWSLRTSHRWCVGLSCSVRHQS